MAITWDASISEPLIYINGGLAPLASGFFVSSTATDNIMTIGSRTDGAQVYTGEIDEFSVWDVVKSPCEIAREMNSIRLGTESNLIRYYNFDQGNAGGTNTGLDFMFDLTAASNDGTLNNFGLTGTTSNWVSSAASISRFYGELAAVGLAGQSLIGEVIFPGSVQWINCTSNAMIVGATAASFNPALSDPNYDVNGTNYAMISTNGICSDTTECFLYSSLSLNEIDETATITIFPNPSNGSITVEMTSNTKEIQILSIKGELLETQKTHGKSEINMDLKYPAGVYFVRVQTPSSSIVKKISIQK